MTNNEHWLNGYGFARVGYTKVLLGSTLYCIGCGLNEGKEHTNLPFWPFGRPTCPVCALGTLRQRLNPRAVLEPCKPDMTVYGTGTGKATDGVESSATLEVCAKAIEQNSEIQDGKENDSKSSSGTDGLA